MTVPANVLTLRLLFCGFLPPPHRRIKNGSEAGQSIITVTFPIKKRPSFYRWYYRLCLSELPFDTAKPEIEKCKPEMLNLLTKKSYAMNSEGDKTMHPVLLCILRNALAEYPEYSYIKDLQPYVKTPGNGKTGGKDGRLYFDFSREI